MTWIPGEDSSHGKRSEERVYGDKGLLGRAPEGRDPGAGPRKMVTVREVESGGLRAVRTVRKGV